MSITWWQTIFFAIGLIAITSFLTALIIFAYFLHAMVKKDWEAENVA